MFRKATAVVLSLALALTVLGAGCSGSPESTGGQSQTGHVSTLYIGTTREPNVFNILSESGSYGTMNYNAFCAAPFVVNDQKGFAQPFIITGWDMAEDQKSMTATFATDQGITWHDGEPLTMDDIIFTFEYLMNVKKASYVRGMTSVEKIDEKTARFTFEGNTAFMVLNKMAMTVYVIPKHIWEGIEDYAEYSEPDAAIGCGPFRLTDIDQEGQTITYERAADTYLGREVTVDKVVVKTYDNHNALVMAVKNGEVDAMYDYSSSLDPSMKPALENVPGVDPGMSINPGNFNIMFGLNVEPTAQLSFRQAVAKALDYELLATAIGGADGRVSNVGSLSPAANGYDDTLPLNETDTAEAARILDEAGYVDKDGDGWREQPDGSPMDVLITPTSFKARGELCLRICEIVKENLAGVNVKTTLDEESVRNSDHLSEVRTSGLYEIYIGYTSPGVAMLSSGIQYMVPGGVPTYLEGTCDDPEFLEAFRLMRASTSVEEYNERMSALQRLVAEHVIGIGLCADSAYFPYRTDKYEGWINFPGYGVINNQTWYSLHPIA